MFLQALYTSQQHSRIASSLRIERTVPSNYVRILHFFNTPPGLDEDTLKQVFLDGEVTEPKSIKLFPSKTERSSSGLLEFANISEALEALVIGNHAPIPNPNSKFPFIMKLCFSSSRHIPNKMAE
ncbi:Heterogeneous nuclear ribonucleoprotein L-like 2 [Homarus americanus]|uniref:Heterogeneous nuclear ribonucleoprotein L-like 2 n=1 Tax=Homarus americanus TaxID=6706 RepID=A0A8J5JVC4_HOMAM|nr:Heterogeneous nuclear ribonucleoprotein L-like 2 [Homarus americanus]